MCRCVGTCRVRRSKTVISLHCKVYKEGKTGLSWLVKLLTLIADTSSFSTCHCFFWVTWLSEVWWSWKLSVKDLYDRYYKSIYRKIITMDKHVMLYVFECGKWKKLSTLRRSTVAKITELNSNSMNGTVFNFMITSSSWLQLKSWLSWSPLSPDKPTSLQNHFTS